MSRRGYPVTEIDFERERDYYSNGREREYEEIDIKRRREPDFLREDYGRTDAGPLVLRERKIEDFEHRPREKPRVRERDIEREELIIRPRERERPREIDIEREEIRYRPRERERPVKREVERDEFIYRPREREKPHEVSYEKDELIVRRGERERPRTPAYEKEEIVVRRGERERPKAAAYEKEEIVVRRGERERPRERDYEQEEIIIRRSEREKEPEPEPEPVPVPEPEPIRAPPIHQEIITHHRHIDHGFERQPAPLPPPRRKSPSPEPSFEEIEIRHRGMRNGQAYDDDIIFERETGRRKARDERVNRRRSLSGRRAYAREELDIAEEADYYNQRVSERAYMGEAYNGATRDWAIVDVPPGTKRVTMDGIGGGSQEVTWQRYNGVRRSKFITEGDEYGTEIADRGRRFVGIKSKQDNMWTEITKDLVVKEAIEELGYDFEETEFFFYVIEYLRYEDVLELVELSEDIRRDRRERIRQIQWERERLNDRRERRPWDEQRVVEREVIYEGRRPGRYLM